MDKTAEILFNYLKNLLYQPDQEPLDIASLPSDFQKLGQGIQFLADCIREEREFTQALAKGDLSLTPPKASNVLAAPAKALQGTLRHLQWQTKQIAKGDYSQRVDFMGEFSRDFNTMTTQLSERTEALIREKKLMKEKNQELKQNLDLMLTLTNYTHNMIFVFSVDPVQQIFANQSARWFLMSNSEEASLLVERLKEQYVEEEQGSANWETELEMDSGKVYYSIESFIGYQNDKKTIVHIISNTTERKKRENFMYTLAYTDTLTGLNNRRYAMNLMDKWIKEETPFVLSFIDVDYLKYCNDTFGHEQGDRYLTATAALLQTLHCEVCRLGGDEFLLLSVGTDAAAQDEQLARLRKLFSEQTDVPYPRSFSFATTAVPARPPVSLSKYLEITDKKMHQYKIRNKRPLSDTSYKDDRRI